MHVFEENHAKNSENMNENNTIESEKGEIQARQKINLSEKEIDIVFHLNLGAVHRLANKYYWKNKKDFSYDELFNNGCMGLLDAINSYDITHPSNATFITYAYHHIRHKITYYMRQNDGLIHVPIKEKKKVKFTFCDYEKMSLFIRDEKENGLQLEEQFDR